MGQMIDLLTERQQGSLPSNSKINLRGEGKEYCIEITLRSGTANDSKRNKTVGPVGNRGRCRVENGGSALTKKFQWEASKVSERG